MGMMNDYFSEKREKRWLYLNSIDPKDYRYEYWSDHGNSYEFAGPKDLRRVIDSLPEKHSWDSITVFIGKDYDLRFCDTYFVDDFIERFVEGGLIPFRDTVLVEWSKHSFTVKLRRETWPQNFNSVKEAVEYIRSKPSEFLRDEYNYIEVWFHGDLYAIYQGKKAVNEFLDEWNKTAAVNEQKGKKEAVVYEQLSLF